MEKATATAQLEEAILLLEIRKEMEYELLKDQVKTTYESLKPVNLVKNMMHSALDTPDLKGDLLNGVMGLAAGYLSKKVAVGETHNPIKNILGTLLQMTVTGIVAKNGDGIKSGIADLIGTFLSKRKRIEQ